MDTRIIGISGSPIKNSNTDRLIQAVLNSSGLESEFIELSQKNIKPCIACLGCKTDNICKVGDDFPGLAEKIKKADAVVVASGIGRGAPGLEETSQQIEHALTLEGMEILGNLKITGNTECLVCGFREICPMSSLPWVFGENPKVTPDKFCRVEAQPDVWEKAGQLGGLIADKIKIRVLM